MLNFDDFVFSAEWYFLTDLMLHGMKTTNEFKILTDDISTHVFLFFFYIMLGSKALHKNSSFITPHPPPKNIFQGRGVIFPALTQIQTHT